MPFCLPHIPHKLAWDQIRASAVTGRRLVATATTKTSGQGLSVFENKLLRGIFEPKTEKVTDTGKAHNKEVHDL